MRLSLGFMTNNPFGNTAQSRWHGNDLCLPRKHAELCADIQLYAKVCLHRGI